jgi:hypothetical protein
MNEQELRSQLRETARNLERWALEAERGGWSTQHVEPMRTEARVIWALLGRSSR